MDIKPSTSKEIADYRIQRSICPRCLKDKTFGAWAKSKCRTLDCKPITLKSIRQAMVSFMRPKGLVTALGPDDWGNKVVYLREGGEHEEVL